MKKKIAAIVLTMTVSLIVMPVLRYDTVFADRIEEVTGEETDGTGPQDEAVIEEVIDEDYDASYVVINAVNFPDANFRSFISDNYDTDHDGILSADEIDAVTDMEISDMNISDLTGIEHFIALTALVCNNNSLTALDTSGNELLMFLLCEIT